jgi:hypothetical protein
MLRVLHWLKVKLYNITCVQELKKTEGKTCEFIASGFSTKLQAENQAQSCTSFLTKHDFTYLVMLILRTLGTCLQSNLTICTTNHFMIRKSGYVVLFQGIVSWVQSSLIQLWIEVCHEIFEQFCAKLIDHEHEKCFWQQNGDSMTRIEEACWGERTVSNVLWPPRSSDLSTCDVYPRDTWRAKFTNKTSHSR